MIDREEFLIAVNNYISRQKYRTASREDAKVLEVLWKYINNLNEKEIKSTGHPYLKEDLIFLTELGISDSNTIWAKFADKPVNYSSFVTIYIPISNL